MSFYKTAKRTIYMTSIPIALSIGKIFYNKHIENEFNKIPILTEIKESVKQGNFEHVKQLRETNEFKKYFHEIKEISKKEDYLNKAILRTTLCIALYFGIDSKLSSKNKSLESKL